MQKLAEMKNVVKRFPGVAALKGISFDILAGEVHVLLGENGAGKSTLMKILSGVHSPDSGEIVIDGKSFSSLTPADAYRQGVSVIYQELSVIDSLSIQENLFLGHLPVKKTGPIQTVDYKLIGQRSHELMQAVGLYLSPETIVETLSIAQKQQVEIAKALAADSKIIVMDEPTSSLTAAEVEYLFSIIGRLKAQGRGIVFISHKLPEIMAVGDRVTVLKDGGYVDTKKISEVTPDDLVTMMVGRQVEKNYQSKTANFYDAPVIFEVKNLSRKDSKAKNISFKLHGGEILGFAGLVGAGRSEMMNSVFGAEPKTSGEIFIHGKRVKITSPYTAIKHSLAMVTENRRKTGFFKNFDIEKNISILPFIKQSKLGGIYGLINRSLERKWSNEQCAGLNVKCHSVHQLVSELSGGNQQKVILGKWLAAESRIIIFDEPTKGIDIGAKSEIYSLMRRLASSGHGVIVVSSELPELLAVCDTIAVYREGEIVKTFNHSDATEEKIMLASTKNRGESV